MHVNFDVNCIIYFSYRVTLRLFFFCFLDISLILDQVAAYDTKQKKMDFFDPSRKDDFLFISGTKVISLQYFVHIL